jgi:hypothetical protein
MRRIIPAVWTEPARFPNIFHGRRGIVEGSEWIDCHISLGYNELIVCII